MSASAPVSQPLWREEKAAARSSQPGTKSSVTLERLFEQCVGDVNEAAQRTPEATASQLSAIARKVDDSYFRLQIWGSDLSGDSQRKITFADILAFEDSPLPETVYEILKNFQDTFQSVGDILTKILEHAGNTDVKDLLSNLRTTANDISELVRGLVDLSSSIQIEQALRNNNGPHKDIQDNIDSTKERIQRDIAGKENIEDCISLPGLDVPGPHPKVGGIQSSIDDPIAWAGKIVLTLDGGGIRNYSTLLILKHLMKEVAIMEAHLSPEWHQHVESASKHASDYLLCHYFDYIVGTSTGGLIAIMLGRLRMNINDCIDAFLRIGKLTFSKPRILTFRNLPFFPSRAKYGHRFLKKKSTTSFVCKLVDQENKILFFNQSKQCAELWFLHNKKTEKMDDLHLSFFGALSMSTRRW